MRTSKETVKRLSSDQLGPTGMLWQWPKKEQPGTVELGATKFSTPMKSKTRSSHPDSRQPLLWGSAPGLLIPVIQMAGAVVLDCSIGKVWT